MMRYVFALSERCRKVNRAKYRDARRISVSVEELQHRWLTSFKTIGEGAQKGQTCSRIDGLEDSCYIKKVTLVMKIAYSAWKNEVLGEYAVLLCKLSRCIITESDSLGV